MNIFAISDRPVECAQMLDDRRLVKMVLETAQLLCTAARINDYVVPELKPNLYNNTHVNHPCSIWARANFNNYYWLYTLFNNLSAEYTHRYNKVHKSWHKLYGLLATGIVRTDTPTSFPNCTPYKDMPTCWQRLQRFSPGIL